MGVLNIVVASLGIGIGFYVQTIAGFAASLFAVPVLLSVLSMQEAIALISVFLLIFSVILVYRNWHNIEQKTLLELSIGIFIGLSAGILILKTSNPLILKKMLGVFIFLFIAYNYFNKKKIRIPGKLGLLFGLAGGMFSGMFSAGGPTYVMYVYSKVDSANIFRATLIGILAVTNTLRIPMLIVSDILTMETLIMALYILPVFVIALLLGNKTYHKVNEEKFKHILMILLGISGLSLITG
ncbi:MAG: sulfite exporter TauE/SafE family protein [Bacteroidales bacterium]